MFSELILKLGYFADHNGWQRLIDDLSVKADKRFRNPSSGGGISPEVQGTVGIFRCFPSVEVRFDRPLEISAPFRSAEIFNIVADRENDLIGQDPLFREIQREKIRKSAKKELSDSVLTVPFCVIQFQTAAARKRILQAAHRTGDSIWCLC